jgi:ATP-dependent Clp protease ATP-binding subunit ClpC
LEEGKLTDSTGRTIDFRNTIILLTSNVGAETIKKQSAIGFTPSAGSAESSYELMREKLKAEAKTTFKPEFLNRLDDVIVFHTLSKIDLTQILHLEIAKLSSRLEARNLRIQPDTSAIEFLIQKGYDPAYGARPMRRAVEQYIEDPLAEELIKGKIAPNETVTITVKNNMIVFTKNEELVEVAK